MSEVDATPSRRTTTIVSVAASVMALALPTIPMLLTTIYPPSSPGCGPADNCTEGLQRLTYIAGGFVALLAIVMVTIAWTCPPRTRFILLAVTLLGSMCGSGVVIMAKPWDVA